MSVSSEEEAKQQSTLCPCCGTKMDSRESGNKILLRCPECGVDEVRLKN